MNILKSNNYHFKITINKFIYLLLLWLLIYIEPLTIESLKISQIWKAAIVLGILVYIISKNFPYYIWFGILFSLKYLIYNRIPYGYLRAVQDTLEALIFPVFLAFFYIKFRKYPDSSEKLVHIAILLSIFIIYSTVPFLFGLKSLNPIDELDKYGLDTIAIKGLFYHIASSSKLFTVATIVLIHTYKQFSKNFIYIFFWLVSVLLGTYFIYQSWTRTSWFIFLIALAFSFFYGATIKHKIFAIVGSILILLSISSLYQTNEAFRLRLKGGTTYRTDTELNIDQLASARLPFILVAIDNLKDQGLLGQIVGYGSQKGMDLFEEKTGMAIVSHNRTFEILESSGIVGLFLYLTFIYILFIKIRKKLKISVFKFKKLTYALMIIFLGFYLSSHGTPLWGEIIFACIFSAIIIHKRSQPLFIKINEK